MLLRNTLGDSGLVLTGSGFAVTNNGYQYSPSRAALVITKGSTVISNEPIDPGVLAPIGSCTCPISGIARRC